MDYVVVNEELWGLIHQMSPYIWYVKSTAAGICFVLLFFQSWKVSKLVLGLRYMTIVGAALIAASIWPTPHRAITALGPLGDITFWTFYALHNAALVWKLMPALRAQMALQPPFPEKVIMMYATGGKRKLEEAVIRRSSLSA